MNVALRPEPLDYISLCTGAGGLDLGVELAIPHARAVLCMEREAFAVAHLVEAMQQGLLAPAPVWSDVRTFNGRPWRGLVDGLVGGIPCQPHSLAGKRLAEEDERDLWSDARRIIVQSRPWFVLIENVRGMLTSGGLKRVWRDLRRLCFSVECGLFTATEVGASHQRERVFILAVADACSTGTGRHPGTTAGEVRQSLGEGRGDREYEADWSLVGGPELADAKCHGWRQGAEQIRWRESEPALCGEDMVNTSRDGRREGKPEPVLLKRRDASVVGASAAMADTTSEGRRRVSIQPRRQDEACPDAERCGAELAEADVGLFPPGPSDLDGWRRVLAHSPQLEPAVRRMADGVAARLDLAGPHAARIERLRMLGNGVVSLEAAYAIRTLATRLARRSALAGKLLMTMGA